jgi:hypothetical protein
MAVCIPSLCARDPSEIEAVEEAADDEEDEEEDMAGQHSGGRNGSL